MFVQVKGVKISGYYISITMYRLKNTKQHVIDKFEGHSFQESNVSDYDSSMLSDIKEEKVVKKVVKKVKEPVIINKYYGDVHIDNRNIQYQEPVEEPVEDESKEADEEPVEEPVVEPVVEPVEEPVEEAEVEKAEPVKESEEVEDESVEDEPVEDEPVEDEPVEDELVEEPVEEAKEADEEPENINAIYEYDNKKYILENEKFLQKRFDDIDSTTSYSMNLCMYKCVRNGCTPYLLYLMVYDNTTKTYSIPNYPLGVQSAPSVEEIQDNIMESVKKQLFDLYPPTNVVQSQDSPDSSTIFDEDVFKGFFIDADNGIITMVYDTTRVMVPLSSTKQYCWVSPYEIFVSSQVANIPISDSVRELFKKISGSPKNHDFYHLKNLSDNTIVKTPYVLFMCKEKVDTPETNPTKGFLLFDLLSSTTKSVITYENVLKGVKDVEAETEKEQILFPRIQHPDLGSYTMFSSNPISKTDNNNNNNIKRFAVFVDTDGLTPLYLSIDETDKIQHLYDIDAVEQYSSITYSQNDMQLWCIKSSIYFSEIEDNGNYVLEIENLPPQIGDESSLEQGEIKEEGEEQVEVSAAEPAAEQPQVEQAEEPAAEQPQVEQAEEPAAEQPQVEQAEEPAAEPAVEQPQVEQAEEPAVEPVVEQPQVEQSPVVEPAEEIKEEGGPKKIE